MTTSNGQVSVADAGRVVGVRGLRNLSGRIQEEYLALLKDTSRRSKIWLEMLDDVTIATLLDAIKWPLLAADFDVEAASEDEVDQAAKAFLWENMNNMS